MNAYKNIFLVYVCLVTSACTVGPDYVKPDISAAENWHSQTSINIDKDMDSLIEWWSLFDDPLLDDLIRATASNNLDVKIAKTRLQRARSARRSARARQLPNINASSEFRKRQISEETASAEAGLNQAGLIERQTNQYELGFDASFEIDIFGGTRRLIESTEADIIAADLSVAEVRTTVLAEVGRAYWQLRGAQYQYNVLQANLDIQVQTLDIIKNNQRIGLSTSFDVQRISADVAATQATLPTIDAIIRANAYAIDLLTGEPSGHWLQKLQQYDGFFEFGQSVPIGIPADVLRRRPDIRRSEQQLISANARVGVAIADLYPKFFLSGIGALQAENTGDLISATAFAFSLGPTVSLPLFQGGRIQANIDDKRAEYERSLYEYEQSILRALNEVETQLTRYDKQLKVVESMKQAVHASRNAAILARQLYKDGITPLLVQLDAERELRAIEIDYVSQQTTAMVTLIALFKSLGGGWDA